MDKNRKFQWICISISVVFISQKIVFSQKLTEIENLKRLSTCGKEFLPQPSQDQNGVEFHYTVPKPGWLLWISQAGTTNVSYIESAGFSISEKYVLTSSQLVLTADKKWAIDGMPFGVCNNGTTYTDLPDHVVKKLIVYHGLSKTFNVLRGRILHMCDTRDFSAMFTPLLLEVTSAILQNFPCLSDESTKLQKDDEVHSYGLDSGKMKHRKVHLDQFRENSADWRWIYTKPPFLCVSDRGGPLVMNSDGKATVIGLKASTNTDLSEGTYFYDMALLQKDICEYSGVCNPKNAKNVTQASTTVSPVTDAPEEDKKPSESPRPSDKDSPKKEEKEEKRKKPYENSEVIERKDGTEMDEEDDFGLEIFVDKDFFNGITRFGNFLIIFGFVGVLVVLE